MPIRTYKRPVVRQDFIGRNISLRLMISGQEYQLDHDVLWEWVKFNSNVPNTLSWKKKGLYSWPRPSAKMRAFLDSCVK